MSFGKRGLIAGVGLLLTLVLTGAYLSVARMDRTVPTVTPIKNNRQEVLGKKTPQIRVAGGRGGYGAGGMIALASGDEAAVNIGGYDISGKAEVSVYEADEQAVLDYLTHDKEGKQTKNDPDISKFRFIKKLEHEITSSYTDSSKLLLPIGESGIYFLRIALGEVHEDSFVIRSRIGSIVKEGDNEYLFWAQDFTTKRSLSEGSLSLYNLEGNLKEVGTATFDSSGVARTNLVADADVAVVRSAGEKAIVPINLRYLNSGYNYEQFQPKQRITKYFIFTDRPLYRPGDTIYFKSILRDDDDARYTIPGGPAVVKIYDGYGEENLIYEKNYPVSGEGTIAGEYALPTTAKTGYYRLVVLVAGSTENSTAFTVEFFRKPEYSIEVVSAQTEFVAGDKMAFTIRGSYFSGQPLANQKVKYRVYSGDFYEYEYVTERSYFLNEDYRYGYWGGSVVTSGEATLNLQGVAEVPIEARIPENNGRNQVYSIEAEFEDESGNPSFSRKNVLVYAGEYGIYRQDTSYYSGQLNTAFDLPVTLVSHRNTAVAGVKLTAKVKRENWVSYQETDQKYASYRMETEDLPDITAVTDAAGEAKFTFTPGKIGSYNLIVSGTDGQSNMVTKKFYTYVTALDQPYYFGQENNDLTIRTDKQKYLPGDVVRFTIGSTVADRDVFLSLERGRVNRMYVVKMEGKAAVVEVPLVGTDMPNIYAKASSFSSHSLDDAETKVLVSAESKKLVVQVTPNQKTFGPSDTAVVNVETTDVAGNPVSADVAVWAVDKAIYELADENKQKIFDTFWQERYNDTQEAHSLEGITVYNAEMGGGCFAAGTQVLMADGSQKAIEAVRVGEVVLTRESENVEKLVKARVSGIHEQTTSGYLIINDQLRVTANHKLWVSNAWREAGSVQIGDKFVDSGGNEVQIHSIEWIKGKFTVYNLAVEKYQTFFADNVWVHNQKGDARTVFKDTAYWNPAVHTDSSGRAQISFKLPDNLTTWVVAAVAATGDTKVGQVTGEIVVTKDVIVRPIVPNILREGDEIVLSALVQNFTDEEQVFDVELKFDAGEIKTAKYSAVPVGPKEMQQIYWEVMPKVVKDEAKLIFSAKSQTNQKAQDTIVQKIPVRAFGFWEQRGETGDGATTYSLKLAADSDLENSEVQLSLAPTIVGTLPVAMKYLVDYPYGCVEQTTSRFVPAVIAKANPGLFSQALEGKDVNAMIEKGLSRLAMHQQADGGWAWWYSGGSDPFISAYVVEYVHLAEQSGVVVDKDLLNRAKDYFMQQKMPNKEGEVAKAYALTLLGMGDKVEKITDFELKPDILALAVMANYRKGDTNLQTNGLDKLLSMAKTQGDGAVWDAGDKARFASDDASTALAVRAIITVGGEREMAVKGARYLTRNRKSNYWSNTFATALVIRAITDVANTGEELAPNYSYTVDIDGTRVDAGKVTSARQKLAEIVVPSKHIKPEGSTVSITKSGEGQLYSSLVVKEFHTDRNAAAVDHGLNVSREYVNAKGEAYSLAVGDTALVKITVSGLAGNEYYGVVNDELPAGLIPINLTFKNQQFNQDPRAYYYSSYDVTDREVTENGMVLSLYQVSAGTKTYTYKARVISEGTFIVPPATASLMYAPEVYGRSGVSTLTITKESHIIPSKVIEKKILEKLVWWQIVIGVGVVLMGVGAGVYFWKRRKNG